MLQIGHWKALAYKQPAHHNHRYNWSPEQNSHMPETLLLHISLKKATKYLGWFMQVLYL